jgi:hypothetical protein
MKTMSKLAFSVVAALATMGFSAVCCAGVEEVDLPCCTGTTCPTTTERLGIEHVTQTVTFKGVRIGDAGEVVAMFVLHPEYRGWLTSTVLKMPKEKRSDMVRAASARTRISVQCSSFTVPRTLERGVPISCPEGDGVVVTQDEPTCVDPQTGPHGVVEITRVSEEDKERERQVQVEKFMQESTARELQLMGEIRGINEQRRLEINHLGGLRQQILGSGFLGALSGGGSSSY